MKAVLYEAPLRFAVTDVPTPRPGPDDVLIRVVQVGVCATDVHIHSGYYTGRFPLIPGHEVVGVVESMGAEVSGLRVGEQVSVNPNIPCGRCAFCRAGRLGLCQDPRGCGSTATGFFAEFVCVPQALVFSVEGLPLDTAVFTEPAACAMHGVETLQVRPGSSALVLGAGPTGLLLAQLIAASGASAVTVAGPVPYQLTTATALGATSVVPLERGAPETNQARLLAASGGEGYDIVVEATGAVEVGNICVPLTRNGGTVLIYGVTKPAETIAVHPFDIFRREIVIKGSYAEMTSFGAAIAALRAGRARTGGIITHRFALEDYAAALDAVAHDDSAHKVVITI